MSKKNRRGGQRPPEPGSNVGKTGGNPTPAQDSKNPDAKGTLPAPVFAVGKIIDSYSDIGGATRDGKKIIVTEGGITGDDACFISYPDVDTAESYLADHPGAKLVLLATQPRRDGKGHVYKFAIQHFEVDRARIANRETEQKEKRVLKRGGEFRGVQLKRDKNRFGEFIATVQDKEGKKGTVQVYAATAWPSARALEKGKFDFKIVSDTEPWQAVLMYADTRDEIRDAGRADSANDPLAWYEGEGESVPVEKSEVIKKWREAPVSQFSSVDTHISVLERLATGDAAEFKRYFVEKTDRSKHQRPRIARAYFGADLQSTSDGWNPNDADFVTVRENEGEVFAEVMPETQFRVMAETAKTLANLRRIAPVLEYVLENDREVDNRLLGNTELQSDYRQLRQVLMETLLPRLFSSLGTLRTMESNPEHSLSNAVVEQLENNLYNAVSGLEITARMLRSYMPAGATSAVEGHITAPEEFTAQPSETRHFLRRLIESGRINMPQQFRTAAEVDALIEHIYAPAQDLFTREGAGYLLVSDRGGDQYNRFLNDLDQLIGERIDSWVPAFRFTGVSDGGKGREQHPGSRENYANKYSLKPNDLLLDFRIGYGEGLLRSNGSFAGAQDLVYFDTVARRMEREQRVSEMQSLAMRPLSDLDAAERTRLAELRELVAYDAEQPYYQCTLREFYNMVSSKDLELTENKEHQEELEFRTAIRKASVVDLIGYFQQKDVRYAGALEHINTDRFNFDAVSAGTEVWSREAVHAISRTMTAHARALLGDRLTDNASLGMRLHEDDTRSPATSYFEFTVDGRSIPGTRVELSGNPANDKAYIESVAAIVNAAAPFQAELSETAVRRAAFEAEVSAMLGRLSYADERAAALADAPALFTRLVDAVTQQPELESLRSQLQSEFERARTLHNYDAFYAIDAQDVQPDTLQSMRDLMTQLGDFGFNTERDNLQERVELVESIYESRRLREALEEAVERIEDMTATGRAQTDLDVLRPRIGQLRSVIDAARVHAGAHTSDPTIGELRTAIDAAQAVFETTDEREETLERLAANEVLAELRPQWEQRVAEARSVRVLLERFTGNGAQLHDYSDECDKLAQQVNILAQRIESIDGTWRPDAARQLASEGGAAYAEIARLLGARGNDTLRGFFQLLREPFERMRGPIMAPILSGEIVTAGSRPQVEEMIEYRAMIEFVSNQSFSDQLHIAPELLATMRGDLQAIDKATQDAFQNLIQVETNVNSYIAAVDSIRRDVTADPSFLGRQQDALVQELAYYSGLIDRLAESSTIYDSFLPEFSARLTNAQFRIVEVAVELQTMNEARIRAIESEARGREAVSNRVSGVLRGGNDAVARVLGVQIGADDQPFLVIRGGGAYEIYIGNRELPITITSQMFGELLLDGAAEIQYTAPRTISDHATQNDLNRISNNAFGERGLAHPVRMGERFTYVGDPAYWPGDTLVPVGTRLVLIEQSTAQPYNFVFVREQDIDIKTGRVLNTATLYEITQTALEDLLSKRVDGRPVFALDRDNPQYLHQRLDRGEHVFREQILASFAPQVLEIHGEPRYRLRLREAVTAGGTEVLAANTWFDIRFEDGSVASAFNDTRQDITVYPLKADGTYADPVRIPYETYVRTISRGYSDWDMSWEQHRDSQEQRMSREYNERFAMPDPTTRDGLMRIFGNQGHPFNPDGRSRRPRAFDIRLPSQPGAKANPTMKCTDVKINQTHVEIWYDEPAENNARIVRKIELSFADFYNAYNRNPLNANEFNRLNIIVDPNQAQWTSERLDVMRGRANLTADFLKTGLLYHGQRAEFKLSLRGVEVQVVGEPQPQQMTIDAFYAALYDPTNPAVTERADRKPVGDFFSVEWARDLRGPEYELLMQILISPRGIGLSDFDRLHNLETGMYLRAELLDPRTVIIRELDNNGNETGHQQRQTVSEFLQSIYEGDYELPAENQERRQREAREAAAARPPEPVVVEIDNENEPADMPDAPELHSGPTPEAADPAEVAIDDSALTDEERAGWPRLRNMLSRESLQRRIESNRAWGSGRRARQVEAVQNIVRERENIQRRIESIARLNNDIATFTFTNPNVIETLERLRMDEAEIRTTIAANTDEQFDALISTSLQPRLLGGGMKGNLESNLYALEGEYRALERAYDHFMRVVLALYPYPDGREQGESMPDAFIRTFRENLNGRVDGSRRTPKNRFDVDAFLDARQVVRRGDQAYAFDRFDQEGYSVVLRPVGEDGNPTSGERLYIDQTQFVFDLEKGRFSIDASRV